MSLYVEVAKRAVARQTTYRAANIAGLATNSFFGALRTYLFIGLYAGSGVVAGWSLDDAVTFVWIGQALIMTVYMWGWWEIAETIRSGDVISDLSKPFDYYAFWLAQDAGRAIYHAAFRGIPTLLVGIILFDARLPAEPARWLAFLLSVALAVWVSFGLRFIVNLAAFWLLDYRGPGLALMFGNTFFSGLLVPLVYWPDGARHAAMLLPFAAIIQAPVDVILGNATVPGLATTLLFQSVWAMGLMLAGRALLVAAERKVVVQGG